MAAMEAEHASKFGCDRPFTTTNYGITTCPAREWAVVTVHGAATTAAVADMRHGRRVPDVAALLQGATARAAGLAEYEVVSVVLYTGPMVRPLHPGSASARCAVVWRRCADACAPFVVRRHTRRWVGGVG